MAKKKKHGFRRAVIALIVILLIAFAVLGALQFLLNDYSSLVPDRGTLSDDTVFSQDRVNILIIGTDVNDVFKDKGRADSIILATVDLVNNELFLMSIPRDTYVNIPDHGKDKINHSYAKGGVNLTIETVEQLLLVPVDYYAVTNFNGFKEVIDLLGGVDIDVDKDMYFRTYDGIIDIDAGMQHLDGDKALQFVRYRNDPLGDITRTERQQKFLKALFEKMIATENLTKLPKVIPKVLDQIETDLASTQLIKLANLLSDTDLSTLESTTLPGEFRSINGISYWQPHEAEITQLIHEWFGEVVKNNTSESN